MLEITDKDIRELNDTDLRNLIGLLCEADLSKSHHSTAGVTYGGHQDASDGGLDVRVSISTSLNIDGFIPKANTGFQVKKPNMTVSMIAKEMAPNGKLREVIKDLVDQSGGYIIVSSKASVADKGLRDRLEEMRKQIAHLPNSANLKVDFYDSKRIATWVQSHPSLILWVREKISKPLNGWKPYGNWANTLKGAQDEYLTDSSPNLMDSKGKAITSLEGINEIRGKLSKPKSSVRLIGLSGTGKTRLLQALFDERLGINPLNKSSVFYTDLADEPIPTPQVFGEQLLALNKPLILAVDNCNPDLHKRLTDLCGRPNSFLSLITLEYDVKDDFPEETEVFRLTPNSDEIIRQLIKSRYPRLSDINVGTITKLSGGNARIAIALASTVKRTDQLATLKDKELYERLFFQRNNEDKSLLEIGQVCSLVYSFSCQTESGNNQELSSLCNLANMSIRDVFKGLKELKRRQLIQQRGSWMAVLPHALANKLALIALEDNLLEDILKTFEQEGNDRLLLSFSKRLSYLHESVEAKKIAIKWLSPTGILWNLKILTKLGMDLLKNIAPVAPESVLAAIESTVKSDESGLFLSRDNHHFFEFANLLRLLAYEPELFDRSTYLLCKLATSESTKENRNSIRSVVEPLFYIMLSGTHAKPEQRLEIINNLVTSRLAKEVELGINLLRGTLKTRNISGNHQIDFGAKTRDYGYRPKNEEEVIKWYTLFINFIDYQIKNGKEWAKELLAECYCTDFLRNEEIFNKIGKATESALEIGEWGEGWASIKSLRRSIINEQNLLPEQLERLDVLEQRLSPNSLTERIKTFVLSNRTVSSRVTMALEDESSNGALKAIDIAQKLGKELGDNQDIIGKVLEELGAKIFTKHANRIFFFGKGLAEGSKDPQKVWMILHRHIMKVEPEARSYEILQGFIDQISRVKPSTAEKILGEIFNVHELRPAFVPLQLHTEDLNEQAIYRIKTAIINDYSPLWAYSKLCQPWINKKISDQDLSEILKLIIQKDGGGRIAIDIINGSFTKGIGRTISEDIIKLGQQIALDYDLKNSKNLKDHFDYDLGEVIKKCFQGNSAAKGAKLFCQKIHLEITSRYSYHQEFEFSLRAIAALHPHIFLDEFLGDEIEKSFLLRQIFEGNGSSLENPLDEIDVRIIIEWCNENPIQRYPSVAYVLTPYTVENNQKVTKHHWTPLALKILDISPNVLDVLASFRHNFRPKVYNGPISQTMERFLPLFEVLKKHKNEVIAKWAIQEEVIFKSEIEERIKLEEGVYKSNDERFE